MYELCSKLVCLLFKLVYFSNFFMTVIVAICNKLERLQFQSLLIFAGKAKSLPLERLEVANTLTYYDEATIAALISFKYFLKTFLDIIYFVS
jgi:hypothetical protein